MPLPLLPLIAAAPGIVSGVANVFGAKRRRAEEQKASAGISQLSDVFSSQLKGNYMDTAEASGAMNAMKNQHQENNQMIDATAAQSGMTDEAKIAMMGRNNQATAGGMSNMAQSADLWRSRLLNQKQGALGNLFQVGQANRQNFNQSLSNVVNPLAQGLGGAINAGAFDDAYIGKRKV
jgi:hypothetical protein